MPGMRDDPKAWPPVKLDHLRRLTDDTGLLEHSLGAVPNPLEGYTVDDNARALAVAARLARLGHEVTPLATRYLSFLLYAVLPDGRFHNDVSYARTFEDDVGPEDTQGRVAWGLAEAILSFSGTPLEEAARRLFAGLKPHLPRLRAPRAQAYALIGLATLAGSSHPLAPQARELMPPLGQSLTARYQAVRTSTWRWFEDRLTYDNARLPHALLLASQHVRDSQWSMAGLESLSFLWELLWRDDHLELVGNKGWYQDGGTLARFDQQPLDAAAMVEGCLAAYEVTGESGWYDRACQAFQWFLGRNAVGLPLYDPETGGCRDGLQPDRVNVNEGAESTLSYLLARLALERAAAASAGRAEIA